MKNHKAWIRVGSAFLYENAESAGTGAPGEGSSATGKGNAEPGTARGVWGTDAGTRAQRGDIVDEVFCGWPVWILGEKRDAVRVRTFYGYEGWLETEALTGAQDRGRDDSGPARETAGTDRRPDLCWVTAAYADVLALPRVQGRILLTVPRGGILWIRHDSGETACRNRRLPAEGPCQTEGAADAGNSAGTAAPAAPAGKKTALHAAEAGPEHAAGEEKTGYLPVCLPDGQPGFVSTAAVGPVPSAVGRTEGGIRDRIVRGACSYLGTQYRWGGKSPSGIDCSGLAFMSCLMAGIPIYRDAAMPEGYPVHEVPKEALRPGDLVYFPGHVAVSLGGERLIHATGRPGEMSVVKGSLSPREEGYRPDLRGRVTGYGSLFPMDTVPELTVLLMQRSLPAWKPLNA